MSRRESAASGAHQGCAEGGFHVQQGVPGRPLRSWPLIPVLSYERNLPSGGPRTAPALSPGVVVASFRFSTSKTGHLGYMVTRSRSPGLLESPPAGCNPRGLPPPFCYW